MKHLNLWANDYQNLVLKNWYNFIINWAMRMIGTNPNKHIRSKTSMLQSDLCGYSDAYIIVKVTITVTGADNRDRKDYILST